QRYAQFLLGFANIRGNTRTDPPADPPANPFQSRMTVAAGFLNSTENHANEIIADYQTFLGRMPDAGGMNAWLSVLASGGHQEDVIRSIVASPEYFGRQGGSNAGFVSGLYHDLLGRSAAPREL